MALRSISPRYQVWAGIFLGIGTALLAPVPAFADGPFAEVVCPKTPENIPEITRASVYQSSPFKGGEKATYELSYAGMRAGYADIEAKSPSKHDGIWHRIFSIDAKTGDWFRSIFFGHDQAMS
ncbi:MAG: hypothetical protein EBU49_07220, partial [Proteobacteria bacterium]|nr:hypothetical protein [Pseudomonadota bacterium]